MPSLSGASINRIKSIYSIPHMFLIIFLKHLTCIKVMNSFALRLLSVSINIPLIKLQTLVFGHHVSLLSMRIEISSEESVCRLGCSNGR